MTEPEDPFGEPDLAGLAQAYHRYEQALADDDLETLSASFADGPQTLRGDAAGLLVGHQQITTMRSQRGGIAARTLVQTHVRQISPDAALVIGVSRYVGGGQGLQTQLWIRTDQHWKIHAAHVTGRPAALDRAVWRVIGDPLVRGATTGPLDRIRVAVKDLYAVAGFAIGAGVPAWLAEAKPCTEHADAVRVLLAAGADVMGIARTDELAYSLAGANPHYGTPANAVVPGALPGGSTNGPACAVATGQADLGLGTDTAGSIRVPASYQGLWALRPTHGRASLAGAVPLADSFDTVSWLARDADLLERAIDVGLPEDPNTLPQTFEPVLSPLLLADLPTQTRSAFDAAIRERVGPVGAIDLAAVTTPEEIFQTFRVLQMAQAWRNHGAFVSAHPAALGDDVASRFREAAALAPERVASATTRRSEIVAGLSALLAGRILLMPTVPGPAPSLACSGDELDRARHSTMLLTTVAPVGGLPAVSAPAMTIDSAPVGISLIGPAGSDRSLLSAARRWFDSQQAATPVASTRQTQTS